MKKSLIILIIAIFVFSFIAGFLIGKSTNLLNKNEINCLININSDEQIIISKDQAICLANNQEAVLFYGIGNPIYPLDEYTRLMLRSNKIILVEDNTSEFQNQLENLDVQRVSK